MANGLGFIDPSAGGVKETVLLAARPSDLTGKVVGLLDNTKEQADIILQTIGEALCERYGVHEAAYFTDKFREYFNLHIKRRRDTDACVLALKRSPKEA